MIRAIANVVEFGIVILIAVAVTREPSAAVRWMGGQPANERLRTAAWMGDQDAFADALRDGATLEARDDEGGSALAYAAMGGRIEMVRRLLDRGAEINGADRFGYTALMRAASAGHPKVVGLLLARGANPELRAMPASMTALDMAAMSDAGGCARVLRDAMTCRAKSNSQITPPSHAGRGLSRCGGQ